MLLKSLTLALILSTVCYSAVAATEIADINKADEGNKGSDSDYPFLESQNYKDLGPAHPSRFILQGGITYFQFNYKEDWAPPSKSMENGANPGISLMGKYRTGDEPEALQLQGTFDYASGNTNYDGGLQNSSGDFEGATTSTTNDKFANIEGDAIFNLSTITPKLSYLKGYTGLGIHSWTRKITGTGGLEEDYSWAYLPLGIRFETKLAEKIDISFDAALKLMFAGSILIHYTDIDPTANNPQPALGNEPGYKFQMPVSFRLSPTIRLVATPFYEYSAIGQSDNATIITDSAIIPVHEPASTTSQYGGTLSVAADL